MFQDFTKNKHNSAMEAETIKKNGVSRKCLKTSRVNKKYFIPYLFVISMIMMQSCATMTLGGNHAFLNNNTTYSGVDMKLNSQYSDFPDFSTDLYIGLGKLDFAKSDLVYSEMDEASKIAPSLGVGLTYYFSLKRLQPIVSLEYNFLFWSGSEIESDKKVKQTVSNEYNTVIPKAGLRFYITNKVAINGYLGYQFGWAKIERIKQNFQGFMPSVSVSFSLSKKEHK